MYYGKEVRIFLKGNSKESYHQLEEDSEKISNSLINSIKIAIEILKENPQFGDPIAKRIIPKNIDVRNLYRIELSDHWRLLYTIESDGKSIIIFIFEIINHKEYNRLFGYR